MRETPEDIAELQALLDRSYAAGGTHYLRISTPERRVTAAELSERLQGMCLLVLATATADGRPITGPVDGIFYRGEWYFGSAPDSVRFRHIAARPRVSATHLPGEHLAVNVQGTAHPFDIKDPAFGGFRQVLIDTYVPRYGPGWVDDFLDTGPVYARIEADKMFSFQMDPDA